MSKKEDTRIDIAKNKFAMNDNFDIDEDITTDLFCEKNHINQIYCAEYTKGFREALIAENEKKPLKGNPIALFDEHRNAPYLLFEDGRRIYEMPSDK